MKTAAEYADQAARETRRWYGQTMKFKAAQTVPMRCEDFWLQHWQRFPWADPTGGRIIDGEAVEIHALIE